MYAVCVRVCVCVCKCIPLLVCGYVEGVGQLCGDGSVLHLCVVAVVVPHTPLPLLNDTQRHRQVLFIVVCYFHRCIYN